MTIQEFYIKKGHWDWLLLLLLLAGILCVITSLHAFQTTWRLSNGEVEIVMAMKTQEQEYKCPSGGENWQRKR